MATTIVTHRGIDQLQSLFKLRDTPYYSVWIGKSKLFENTISDMEEAERNLINNLQAPLQNGTTAVFTIKFYKKVIQDKEENDILAMEIGENNFRLNEFDGMSGPPENRQPYVRNNELLNEIKRLHDRLDILENEESEDPGQNVLGSLLGNPAIQEVLSGVLANLLTPKVAAGIAGVNDNDEKIIRALEILKKADPSLGDHLLKLAAIAQNNPGQFNMLLKML
jgi:hypothetical protein